MAAILLLVSVSAVLVPTPRRSILRAAGWALVAEDQLAAADVIVIAVDAGGAGVLEAADLVHGGIATRVALFAEPTSPADREFVRRGVLYEDTRARSARHLRLLGVSAIEQIPGNVEGTEAEGRVLIEWCIRRQFSSVVVVSNADHSRRLRRVLHRSTRGHHVRVSVRSSRYSRFDPDRWWEARSGIRTEIVEFQKLLFDIARHPIS